MTKIVVFAYSLVGHACLKWLLEADENIVGVFTHPDNPGEKLWFPSVAHLASEQHIPVIATEDAKDPSVLEALQKIQPDILLSFYYRKMIPDYILNIPPLGCFNMHGSLLPRYRGRAPLNWALVHGETETGATLHHMVKSADAGSIVDQESIPIHPTDTAFELTHRVADAAVEILKRQMSALKEGTAPSIPQDETKATYFGGRSAKDSEIHWEQSAWQIHNLIRAVPYPYFPPAFTIFQGEKLEIRRNKLPSNERLKKGFPPGQIIEKGKGWIRVACGDGHDYLDITELSCSLASIPLGKILID
ncbi:MAG: formyltransferase [Alphaproteobacteria bacterium]|nr:formyltransferase [Alphaproteobacteria bacterium]